jgi:hypothetical protein
MVQLELTDDGFARAVLPVSPREGRVQQSAFSRRRE